MNLDKRNGCAKSIKVIISLVKAGKIIDYDAMNIELKILDIQKKLMVLTKSQDLKTESINTFF
jgi:hypothetical protein